MDRTEYTGLAVLILSITVACLSGVSWWVIVGTLAAGIVGLIGWAIWMEITEKE